MAYYDEKIFHALDVVEQQQIEYVLKETGNKVPNWLEPTDKDYQDAAFAFMSIKKYGDDPNRAIETLNLVYREIREKSDKVIQKRMAEKEKGEVLTLDDFDGHWGNFKTYLDDRYNTDMAELKQIRKTVISKYCRDMINPNTGEIMRLQ